VLAPPEMASGSQKAQGWQFKGHHKPSS